MKLYNLYRYVHKVTGKQYIDITMTPPEKRAFGFARVKNSNYFANTFVFDDYEITLIDSIETSNKKDAFLLRQKYLVGDVLPTFASSWDQGYEEPVNSKVFINGHEYESIKYASMILSIDEETLKKWAK